MGSKSDLLPLHEAYTPGPAGLVEVDPTDAAEVPVSSVTSIEEVETTNERLGEDGTLKLGFHFAFPPHLPSDKRQN